MNDAVTAIAMGRRIDLTREPDVVIAGLRVRPTACEVIVDGRRLRLQPRMMQVLIALARTGGEPVSREALIDVCWGKVTVSEDALNRCIQRLRRLAQTEANGAFAIETIPRIGYRLTVDPAFAEESGAVSSARDRPSSRPMLALWRKVVGGLSGLARSSDPAAAFASAIERPPTDKPTIAVLPLVNLSGRADRDDLAVGVAEEITRSLSRFRTLYVVLSGASPPLTDELAGPGGAAHDTGARYQLEGSVRKAGGRVRIAVKLMDTSSGYQLWAHGFDDVLDDVFALQDKVALAVAGAVEPAVMGAEIRRAVKHPSEHPDSYELYLRALPHCTVRSKSEYRIAIDLLDRAIALDPNYRYALSMAAHMRSQLAIFGWADDPEANRRCGAEQAHRAVVVAADDAVVLANAATAIARLEGDMGAATALFERATGLNPASSYTWFLSGLHQAQHGDPETAVAYLETSLRLDPLAHRSNAVGGMATARYRQGRFDDAIALAREFVLRTDSPQGHACLAGAYARLGQASAALEALGRYRALSPVPIEDYARIFLPQPAEVTRFLDAIAAAEAKSAGGSTSSGTAPRGHAGQPLA